MIFQAFQVVFSLCLQCLTLHCIHQPIRQAVILTLHVVSYQGTPLQQHLTNYWSQHIGNTVIAGM